MNMYNAINTFKMSDIKVNCTIFNILMFAYIGLKYFDILFIRHSNIFNKYEEKY